METRFGALPLSAEAWQSEFDKYKAIPEYELQNKGMSLAFHLFTGGNGGIGNWPGDWFGLGG